jgi:GNAT superfamily N-acetyltransferase
MRSQPSSVVLRRATALDADEIADVWLAAFAATYAFPPAHTDDEVRSWLRQVVVCTQETWVAVEPAGTIAGFMSLTETMLDQLYLRPDVTGRGLGSRFAELAKARRPRGLDLYSFQVNEGARRFYERHGFVVLSLGDGSANEEGQPDVRYRWTPSGTEGVAAG